MVRPRALDHTHACRWVNVLRILRARLRRTSPRVQHQSGRGRHVARVLAHAFTPSALLHTIENLRLVTAPASAAPP
eukprot:1075396-Prymnesium_polylepis.1